MLFDRVGQGGMAGYLARQATSLGGGKLFVVKLILPVYADRAEFAEMLIAEAKLAATLSHQNIATVFDLGREDGRLFIAMEYVEGLDLAALLKRCSKDKIPLPPELALRRRRGSSARSSTRARRTSSTATCRRRTSFYRFRR